MEVYKNLLFNFAGGGFQNTFVFKMYLSDLDQKTLFLFIWGRNLNKTSVLNWLFKIHVEPK